MLVLLGLNTITNGLVEVVNDATTFFGLFHTLIGGVLLLGEVMKEV